MNLLCSPPELPQALAELGIVQLWMLVGQLPPGSLRPHHKGVHRPLDVGPGAVGGALGDGHRGPVVICTGTRNIKIFETFITILRIQIHNFDK